jgi:hypothetical protein
VQPIVYELDSGPTRPIRPAEPARSISPVDGYDQALALAIQCSQHEALLPSQRDHTGTEEDDLARAISLSLLEI